MRSGWEPDQYQLLDFGGGRKLERFGSIVLDRPSPAAQWVAPERPSRWPAAHIRIDTKGNVAHTPGSGAGSGPPDDWQVRFQQFVFSLKVTPFGHVGLFPEQAENWQWLMEAVPAKLSRKLSGSPPKGLNLFGYTGGTTLALAAAGVEVVHVDASAPAVKWARRNAAASGFAEHPIRWIVDDARKFVARELRRGNRYSVIVLDPPSYGHGPKGDRWDIARDLDALLHDVCRLLEPETDSFLLFTCHSDRPSMEQVASSVRSRTQSADLNVRRLTLQDENSRLLDLGYMVRGRVSSKGL